MTFNRIIGARLESLSGENAWCWKNDLWKCCETCEKRGEVGGATCQGTHWRCRVEQLAGFQSTTFSCLTRRNHKTNSSAISYYFQLVPQTPIKLPFLLESTLFSSKSSILSASEAADVFLRPTRAPSTLIGRQDTSRQ